MRFQNGYYLVDGEMIENKVQAIIAASKKGSSIQWCFYDDVFAQVKHDELLADVPIEQVYKERAIQLRESYDYLILNYSGGSDSHNVLQAFLKNNIKLDHIFVQWPMSLVDKGIYVPNARDKSNANFQSEWDLVLKKDIEYLSKAHPEIKIEIVDWCDKIVEDYYSDDIFTSNATMLQTVTRSIRQSTFSSIERELTEKGKKVASIFGVDKPNIVKKGNDWFFYFVDESFGSQENPDNPNGVEYFYNTPLFPELSVIQALKLVRWYRNNPKMQYLIRARSERTKEDPTFPHWSHKAHYAEFKERNEIAKLVCYPHWSFDRFQADKPVSQLDDRQLGVQPWDNILMKLPTFARAQQTWAYHWSSYLKEIDLKFMRTADTVNAFQSKWFYLCSDNV